MERERDEEMVINLFNANVIITIHRGETLEEVKKKIDFAFDIKKYISKKGGSKIVNRITLRDLEDEEF